jgi:hypothetical protein
MPCQILTASLAEVAKPAGVLAEMARPQSSGMCRTYDFSQFIITLVDEIPMTTFDNVNIVLL